MYIYNFIYRCEFKKSQVTPTIPAFRQVALADRTGCPTLSPLLAVRGPMAACWLGVLLTAT